MSRALIPALVLAAVIVLVTGSSATGRAAKTVLVEDDVFSPASLTIKEDTKVRFEWVGEGQHSVYKKIGPGRNFDSLPQETGFVYTRTFKRRGNYVLACTLHQDMLMDLRVKRRR